MSEKMRNESNEWCDSQGFSSDRYEMCDLGEKYKHLCGEYVIRDSRIMWMAWQASRAALVVELPPEREERFIDSYQEGWNDAIDSCRVLVESVGVTCK